MKHIPLTQGKFAIVDDEDFDWLSQWKWCFNQGYAARTQNIGTFNGKEKKIGIQMHRLILGTPNGVETDHHDGDGLNNQRDNLREATSSQNQMNRASKINSTSLFKGVSWSRHKKRWVAQITINKKVTYIGSFRNEVDAAKAYNEAAIIHYGEFARLNAFSDSDALI